MDNRLNWSHHVVTLCAKLSSRLYLLHKLRTSVSQNWLLNSYYATFDSHIRYGLLLWGHTIISRKVFIKQKIALRIIFGKHFRFHAKPLFIENDILTLPCLYILTCLLYVKDNISSYEILSEGSTYHTRNRGCLMPNYSRLKTANTGYHYWGIKFFNHLPKTVQELNRNPFENTVRTFLVKKAYYKYEEFLEDQINI